MAAKTISFPKGKGHIRHNNRDFISCNVDKNRICLNKYYIQEPLEAAYEKCFGKALENYNAKQKRKDRIKGNYITEIKNSGNGEKVFYENVVQIGDKNDTGIPITGNPLTADVQKATEVLDKYVHTFQERNPNLYLFNAVLHMDEATPHLHIDYIPVAHGYKKGMETRNSLTKALQQMGIPKAVSHNQNETVFWQEREREFLKDLCAERGIEVYEKGEKRENLSLPAYKEAMEEIDSLKELAEHLQKENSRLSDDKEVLEMEIIAAKEIEEEIIKKAEALEKQNIETQRQIDHSKKTLSEYELKDEYLKLADASVKNSPEKAVAEQIRRFGRETGFVKVEESVCKKMLRIYRVSRTKDALIEKQWQTIEGLKDKTTKVSKMLVKCKEFLIQNDMIFP